MRFYKNLSFILLLLLCVLHKAIADEVTAEEFFTLFINKANDISDPKKQARYECGAKECYSVFDRSLQTCDHSIYAFSAGTLNYLVQATFSVGGSGFCTVVRTLDGKEMFNYVNTKTKVALFEATPETRLCKKIFQKLARPQKKGIVAILSASTEALKLMPQYLASLDQRANIEKEILEHLSKFKGACR